MRHSIVAIFLWLFVSSCAFAQSQGLDLGIAKSVPSGGSPTWTNQTSGVNASCGFTTSCSVTGVTVPSGFIVVGVGGINEASGASTVSSLTACGTSLTLLASPSAPNGGFLLAEFYGTVTGGSCTISATASGTNAWNTMGVALGELSNLTSTTPGTDCTGYYAASQNAPYPCTSSVTVASGGFAIAVFGYGASATLTSTNLTIDSQQSTVAIGIGHAITTLTPTFGGGNFLQAAIVAAPWR
jgi:hypothetical protein